ncbi:MAG: serine/threonine-protein kinase [Myxococcota bacterium]
MTTPTFREEGCPRCGGGLADGACPRCLLAGEPLELIEEIGRGGMGAVWRARHRGLDRVVAVKFLAEDLAHRPGFADRFSREARLMAKLAHPRIVAVHDVTELEGLPCIVMEHVDGPPLAQLLPLPPGRVVELAMEVCDALAWAHARGVVHRDVKPENILVDAAGHVKVADFGIARALGEPGTATVAGTPAFMSPEAIAGASPDPRMDVFSLGAVVYQAVSGRLPVGAFAPLDGPLDRVVRRALAPAGERYPSIDAMRADLALAKAALDGDDDLAPEERVLQRVVALVLTVATAVPLAALLVSVTPKVLQPGEVRPLVMTALQTLPDGRVVSRARFEEAPSLAAVAAIAVGATAWALLLARWRRHGLLRTDPGGEVPQGRLLLRIAGTAFVVGFVRVAFDLGVVEAFAPLLGGVLEILCLTLFWSGLLEARRTSRPLRRQHALFAGMGIALVPPTVELWKFLESWVP